MKRELYKGIEYHYPETFQSVQDYLASVDDFTLSADVKLALKWDEVRIKRDRFIASTDWTQMPDAPLDDAKKAEFTAYRQALRDIPQTYGDPDAVVWPEKPTV